jgi:hypothetical protein
MTVIPSSGGIDVLANSHAATMRRPALLERRQALADVIAPTDSPSHVLELRLVWIA